MKRYFQPVFLCFFSAIVFSCKNDPELITEGEFSVISYNVAGLPDGISSSDPVRHSDSIGKLLNEFDIVHMQEDFCYHDKIMRNNRHPYFTETSGCVPFGDGLNTLSNFPILQFKRHKWNVCHGTDCLTPKGFSYSKIAITSTQTVDFYNIHANAQSDALSVYARRMNIIQMCEYIKTHSEGEAVIIFGDTNCRYTSARDTIREILALGFTDVWLELLRNNEVPTLGDPSLRDCEPEPTSAGCEVVDKIFYRSSAKVKLTALRYKHDDERYYFTDGEPLSDHSPIFAWFKFNILQ